jgi:hypothetical protein
MTYSSYGLIEAADFNTFVGNATSGISTANTLNTVWGLGVGNAGYGQTGVPNVAAFTLVSHTDWANLINTTQTVASHQGTAITLITPPSQGDRIEVINAITTNLQNIYTSRFNAAAQGTTSSTVTTNPSTWNSAITFTHQLTFASAAQARYFFNAGGQIALTFSHPTGLGVNALLSNLATAMGTLVISSISSGTCSIAGTTYNGITKIGGSGTPTTLSTNTGFYALTTTNQEVYKQLGTGTPSAYTGTFISVNLRLNALPGSGSVLTITTLWDEVPNGGSTLGLTSGSTTTCTIRPPSISYLSNTWGSISVTGSVTGS